MSTSRNTSTRKRRMGAVCCVCNTRGTKVHFADMCIEFQVTKYDQSHFQDICKNEMPNYRLRDLEDFLRKNDILLKGEYLEFTEQPTKHIRIGEVERVARDFKAIEKLEHLRILA